MSVLQALQLVLGQASTLGSQQRSAFTAALASRNISATGTVLSDTPLAGDSLQDQIYALTTEPSRPNKHRGAIIGSSVGAGVALLLLAAACMVFARGWLKKRQLQQRTAVCLKVGSCPVTLISTCPCFGTFSGSFLASDSSEELQQGL